MGVTFRIRTTSTDEFHYHLVEVDEDGNGYTTSCRYNGCDEEIPDHKHDVVDYVCQNLI